MVRATIHHEKPCEECGNNFKPRHAKSRFCSRKCLHDSMTGDKAANWRGGKTLTEGGYIKVLMRDHPRADQKGYIWEHHIIMEKHLGRYLLPGETVHHKDTNGTNNTIDNLELRQGKHGKGGVFVCCDCGSRNVKPIGLSVRKYTLPTAGG